MSGVNPKRLASLSNSVGHSGSDGSGRPQFGFAALRFLDGRGSGIAKMIPRAVGAVQCRVG